MKLRITLAAVAAAAATSFTGIAVGAPQAHADMTPASSCAKADTVKLRNGSQGASVKYAQCLLNNHGAKIAVDGKFGPKTLSATKDFQRSKGLAVDGIIGPKTWSALEGNSGGGGGDESPSSKADKVIDFARSQKGKPYVWGANGPNSYDCSGLTRAAYRKAGVELPRVSRDQAKQGKHVKSSDRKPGDLMYWPGHVGIYAGNGKVIHASSSKQKVVESGVWGSPEYRRVL